MHSPKETRDGLIAAFIAYLMWGVLPVYFKVVADVGALEVLIHRIVWAVPFGALIIFARRQWPEVKRALADARVFGLLALAAVLIAGNWYVYIFAVQNGQDQYRTNDGAGAGENILLGTLISAPTTNGFGAICRVADLDGSGTDDFLVADLDQEFPQDCSRRLHILFNSGQAPYLTDGYPAAVPWTPNGTSDIAILDIDLDNDLDLLIGHCSGNSVFTQDNTSKSEFFRGEVNDDGNLNIADAIALLTYLFPGKGGPPVAVVCDDAADANDDGSVNIADAISILSFLFGAVPLPPPTVCGEDPSEDNLICESFSGCP